MTEERREKREEKREDREENKGAGGGGFSDDAKNPSGGKILELQHSSAPASNTFAIRHANKAGGFTISFNVACVKVGMCHGNWT